MKPKVPGRLAITGRQGNAVWDFLSLSADKGNFTRYPHLTLGVTSQAVEAMVIVPNAVDNVMRRNLKELGEAGFHALVKEVLENLKSLLRDCKGAAPWFRGVQRRFPSRKAEPYLDARIEFDLRTAVHSSGPPKTQPRWLSAAYASFVNKEGSNYQMQMGVVFPYERCPELRQPDAIELVAAACWPVSLSWIWRGELHPVRRSVLGHKQTSAG